MSTQDELNKLLKQKMEEHENAKIRTLTLPTVTDYVRFTSTINHLGKVVAELQKENEELRKRIEVLENQLKERKEVKNQ